MKRKKHMWSAVLTMLFICMMSAFGAVNVMASSTTETTDTTTRGEWMHILVETFEMEIEDGIVPDDYYGDIVDSTYYEDILTAINFGVIDLEPGEDFQADSPVTREFAAKTMNYCLGFQLSEDAEKTMTDVEELSYWEAAQVSVNRGWFELVDGAFKPNQDMTTEEKNIILADAKAVWEAAKPQDNYEGNYSLAEDIIEIGEDIQVSADEDGNIVLTGYSDLLSKGDKVVAFVDEIPISFIVDEISKEDDAYVITPGELDYTEAFEELDLQGIVQLDLANAVPASDNIEIECEEAAIESDGSTTKARSAIQIKDISKSDPSGTFHIDLTNISLNYIIGKDHRYIAVDSDAKVRCCASASKSFSVPLVDIPFAGGLGHIGVMANYTADGSVTLSYSTNFTIGVEWTKAGGYRVVKQFSKGTFHANAQVKASAGYRASVYFSIPGLGSGTLYADAGIRSTLTVDAYGDGNKPTICEDIKTWLYAEVGVSVTFNKALQIIGAKPYNKNNIPIYDWNNTPVKLHYHVEDGTAVQSCSRGKGTTTSGKRSYYTSIYAGTSMGKAGTISSNSGYSGSGYDADTDTVVQIFEYSLNSNNKATITKYNGIFYGVVIPEEIDGYPVVGIGESAFAGNGYLTSVVIPDSVESIGNYAFRGCSSLRTAVLPQNSYLKKINSGTFMDCSALKEIEIPDSVIEIDIQAFENCTELAAVKLPNQLEILGRASFKGCKSLTSIYIPKSLKSGSYWGDYDDQGGIFSNCTSLKEVTFEEGIKQIASNLFWDCDSLENIEIPTTVSKIENGAFGACDGLKKIEVPDSVTEIGYNAFYHCSNLEDIILSQNITKICYSTFQGCSQLQKIEIPNSVTEIEHDAFSSCTELAEVKLSNYLEKLSYRSFKDCKKLTSIHIPKSLKSGSSWGGYNDAGGIFTNCTLLKEVTFEEGITEIANDLFYDCDSLENIEIPDTVSKIGDRAFGACDTLKEIEIPDCVTKIGESAFEYCSHLEKALLSQNITIINNSTFANCSQLKEIKIPNSVTEIEDSAFYGCTELAEVKLSNHLETLGARSFRGCKKLTSVYIPASLKKGSSSSRWSYSRMGIFSDCPLLKEITFEEGITEIANDLFYDCDSLEKIEIPNTVKIINDSAFENCDALNEIVIQNGVKEIGDDAFKACTHLKEINLPDTINSMGTYVFCECSTLTKVHLSESAQNIAEGTFYNCIKLNEVNFSDILTVVGAKAFYNCDALTEVIIPEKVTSIETSAFQDSVNLKQVTLPNSVTTIGSYAFQGCDALESVALGAGLTAIPESCFADCGSLTSMTLPYNVTSIGSKAFANSPKMLEITIPRKTTSINSDAFSYKSRTTVYGAAGTYAETFANENGMIFVAKDIPATEVTINMKNKSMDKGKNMQLSAIVLPIGYNGEVVWSSSDETVAAVDQQGLITTKAYGTAIITVTAGTVSASCNLTVEPSTLQSPVVDKTISTITFNFAPEDYDITQENFTGVSLMGTLPGTNWNTGAAMTLTSEGNYTITLENVPAGDYYYKFKTNSGNWFTDVKNSLIYGENSCVSMPKLVSPDVPELVVTPIPNVNVARIVLPSGWSEPVYCYAYDSSTETVTNNRWPGVQMTKVEGTNNIYEYIVPSDIKAPRVMFYSSDANRYPADGVPGLLFEEENATYQWDGTSWEKINISITPEPTKAGEASTTPEPTKAGETSTTPEPTKVGETSITPEPTKAEETSTTPKPTETGEVSTTPEPTKAQETNTTPKPTETGEVSTTPEPTRSEEVGTTPKPTETGEVSVTPEPTRSEEVGTTPKPTETEEVRVTPEPTRTEEVGTTPRPTETGKVSVTPEPTRSEEMGTTKIPIGPEKVSTTPKASLAPTNTPKPVKAPKKGTKLTDKKTKAVYKVTKAGTKGGTVEYVKTTDKKATKITIPATVKINGITYKVTSIANNAFSKNKQLKFVAIGKNIETIGNKSFYKCTSLTKITIPSKVKKIGKQAFYGCKKLKTINIKTKKLTTKNVGSKAFKGINSKATIKVPKSKITSYKKLLKAKGAGSKVKVKK